MTAEFELKSRRQFLTIHPLLERWKLEEASGPARERFLQLIGPGWAAESIALDYGCEISGLQDATKEHYRQLMENHQNATVWWYAKASGKEPLKCTDLAQLHERLFAGVDPAAGRFRQEVVPPHSRRSELSIEEELIPALLENALGWFESDSFQQIHEIEKTALVLIRLMDLLPFAEGNGITARVFSNFYLLRSGYPPALIPSSLTSQYAVAIQNALHFDTQGIIDLIAQAVANTLAYCIGRPRQDNPLQILEH